MVQTFYSVFSTDTQTDVQMLDFVVYSAVKLIMLQTYVGRSIVQHTYGFTLGTS